MALPREPGGGSGGGFPPAEGLRLVAAGQEAAEHGRAASTSALREGTRMSELERGC